MKVEIRVPRIDGVAVEVWRSKQVCELDTKFEGSDELLFDLKPGDIGTVEITDTPGGIIEIREKQNG